jgi:transcriptional regulator with XRE-family HTH domain
MNIEKKESLLSEMQMKKRSAVADTYIAARKELGLSQKELAERLNTARPNIARFEASSVNATLDFLVKVADAMDMDVDIRLIKR